MQKADLHSFFNPCPLTCLQAPAVLVAWVVAAYSALGHKEFRFLYPILPLVHIYAGAALAHIAARRPQLLGLALTVVLAVNIPMAAYFSLVHQQGTIRVVEHLRDAFALQVCAFVRMVSCN